MFNFKYLTVINHTISEYEDFKKYIRKYIYIV